METSGEALIFLPVVVSVTLRLGPELLRRRRIPEPDGGSSEAAPGVLDAAAGRMTEGIYPGPSGAQARCTMWTWSRSVHQTSHNVGRFISNIQQGTDDLASRPIGRQLVS